MREIASSSIDKNYALKARTSKNQSTGHLDLGNHQMFCTSRLPWKTSSGRASGARSAGSRSPTKAFTAHGSLYSLSARRDTLCARLSTCVRTGLANDPKIPWVKLVISTLLGKKTKDDRAFHFFWESYKAQCDNKRCGKYSVWYTFFKWIYKPYLPSR